MARRKKERAVVAKPNAKKARKNTPSADLSTSTKSPGVSFLQLPAEIRNMIYHYFLPKPSETTTIGRNGIRSENTADYVVVPPYKGPRRRPPGSLALLRVCREVNFEAASILYGSVRFRLHDHDALCMFFKTIGNHKSHIRSVLLTSISIYNTQRMALKQAGLQLAGLRDLRRLDLRIKDPSNVDEVAGWRSNVIAMAESLEPLLEAWRFAGRTAKNVSAAVSWNNHMEQLSCYCEQMLDKLSFDKLAFNCHYCHRKRQVSASLDNVFGEALAQTWKKVKRSAKARTTKTSKEISSIRAREVCICLQTGGSKS